MTPKELAKHHTQIERQHAKDAIYLARNGMYLGAITKLAEAHSRSELAAYAREASQRQGVEGKSK